MFPHRFFAGRFYPGRFFPAAPAPGPAPVVIRFMFTVAPPSVVTLRMSDK